MSASTSPVPRIELWLEGLANLTVAGSAPVDAERITLMAGMLARDGFPPDAFNTDSMHHVTLGRRFFPAYDDVRSALQAWCNAHLASSAPRLAGPGQQGMDAMDRAWEAFWRKRRAEVFGSDVSQAEAEAAMRTVSSLVRAKSPKAWAVISGVQPELAMHPTEAAVAYVAKLLRPEPQPGQPRYEIVEAPPPFRDVTAKGAELARIRGKAPPVQAAVVTDRGDWA